MMINCSIYIFGIFDKEYTQYPNDYTKEVCRNFLLQSKAKSQIIIHRDGDLMYYGYVRKLDIDSESPRCIGFCLLLNGIMFSDIGKLFAVFENVMLETVSREALLFINDYGDIVATTASLAGEQQEVAAIAALIRNGISKMDAYTRMLPTVNYSMSNAGMCVFSYEDNNDAIVEASCKYAYTCIEKDKDCEIHLRSEHQEAARQQNKKEDTLSQESVENDMPARPLQTDDDSRHEVSGQIELQEEVAGEDEDENAQQGVVEQTELQEDGNSEEENEWDEKLVTFLATILVIGVIVLFFYTCSHQ